MVFWVSVVWCLALVWGLLTGLFLGFVTFRLWVVGFAGFAWAGFGALVWGVLWFLLAVWDIGLRCV